MISTETSAGESEYNEPETLEMPEAGKFTFIVLVKNFTEICSVYIAPSGATAAISITVLSSTSLLITWQPPEPLQRNGVITGYEIQLTSLNNDTSQSFEIRENTHSLQVHGNFDHYIHLLFLNGMFFFLGLEKYSEFSIRISARTVVGFGPFSETHTARTLGDGR